MAVKFAFFRGKGTIVDRLICFWMRGEYSHCECILADNGDGTYLCASSVPGIGVRIASIELPPSDWDIIEGPGDVAAAHVWFLDRVGKAYDYIGLLGFIFRPVTIDARDKYWCSEACLLAIGFESAWRYDPNAMAELIAFANPK